MPEYRYYTTDILTGQVLGELPLYGVFMDKKLKYAGNFTGTFRLDTGQHDDQELIDATYPQRTAIFCERNDVTIWGGVLWTRTRESNAKTVQLQAQTFESYISKVRLRHDFIRTDNQLVLLKDLIDLMQSYPRANLRINTDIDVSDGISKTLEVLATDDKFFIDVISELSDADDGFDWYIQVTDSSIPDQPELRLIAGQPVIHSNVSNPQAYSYPGTIDQFYWPESGTKSGTDFLVLGEGQGSDALRAESQSMHAATYPLIDQVFSRKDITNQASLDAIAQSVSQTYGSGISNPTITIKSDEDPEFEGWNSLGADYLFDLDSPVFGSQSPRIVQRRMIGWEFSPESSESIETIKFILEGEEDA